MGRLIQAIKRHFYREAENQREHDTVNIMCDRYLQESGIDNMPVLTFLWLRTFMRPSWNNAFAIFIDFLERVQNFFRNC